MHALCSMQQGSGCPSHSGGCTPGVRGMAAGKSRAEAMMVCLSDVRTVCLSMQGWCVSQTGGRSASQTRGRCASQA